MIRRLLSAFALIFTIAVQTIRAEEITECNDSTDVLYTDSIPANATGPVDPDKPIGQIDPNIPIYPNVFVVDPENPYLPDVAKGYDVGSIQGSLGVSSTGAAEYTIPIEQPDGGSLCPGIALTYNSQNSSVGLAGYGVTLSGLSSITRGERSLFDNNGVAGGVTYTEEDNLYLDGKRLVLQSGSACQEGAIYCLEGDPYTKIITHGSYSPTTATTWFEVSTSDGNVYYYGNEPKNRIEFTDNSNSPRIASWYLSKVTDIHGNYMLYYYNVEDYTAYPTQIVYGLNSNKSRYLSNIIAFEYEGLGGAVYFNIANRRGAIRKRLASISTYTNADLYRKYHLSYEIASGGNKVARLTGIREENGAGDSLPPTKLKWSSLPSEVLTRSEIGVSTADESSSIEENGKIFFAADLNGDGISDIIRISPVTILRYDDGFNKVWEDQTCAYISRSEISPTGDINYRTPLRYILQHSTSFELASNTYSSSVCCSNPIDYDGDGYNDLVLSFIKTKNNESTYISYYVISGSEINKGNKTTPDPQDLTLQSFSDKVLSTCTDTDKDGREDIIFLENKQKDSFYPLHIIKFNNEESNKTQDLSLHLISTPKKLLTGDYNNDGLQDLLVLHDKGYHVFYNLGGSRDDAKYPKYPSASGSNLKNAWRVEQGDFDGDGLADIIYYETGKSALNIAFNNGDGTFTISKAADLEFSDQSTKNDDERFSLLVYDYNRDGKSDVLISKATYNKDTYSKTEIRWYYSDGTLLKSGKSVSKNRQNDAKEGSIFVGDFDGDGNMEAANYGADLTSTSLVFSENKINVYRHVAKNAEAEHVTRITDGLGNTSDISYSLATDPEVYNRVGSVGGPANANTYTLPISLVRSTTISNGNAGAQTTEYAYKDLRLHLSGGGVLGFMEMSEINKTTGERKTTEISKWDEERCIPVETRTTSTLGGARATMVSYMTVGELNNTYYSYESMSSVTDYDGNSAVTLSKYDTSKGVVTEQTVQNNGDKMYKKVEYKSYVNKSGVWLPQEKVMSQKHSDSPEVHSRTTVYVYDARGNILRQTDFCGTDQEVSTTCTYDIFGNRLTSVTKGRDVTEITHYNVYDNSGRFPTRTFQKPAAAVNTFTYDKWGNVLTETDETDPANVLSVKNIYDNWGRLVSTTAIDGTVTENKVGWNSATDGSYYIFTSTSGKPWVKTTYDPAGNETSKLTFGPKNMLVASHTYYNDKGLISKISNANGKLRSSEFFTYDEFGRVLKDSLSSGKVTEYAYKRLSVIVSSDGRTARKTSDAWGNVVSSRDALGNEVKYTYGAIGKPEKIESNGSVTTTIYNGRGLPTRVIDPDAGESQYTYTADGVLKSKTDAKGTLTKNIYDNLGRLRKVEIDNDSIVYIYGTSGNTNLRLTNKVFGDKSVQYVYDNLGRVTAEIRKSPYFGSQQTRYTYDSKNRLATTVYPQNLVVNFGYDDYGFMTSMKAAGKEVFRLEEYDGEKYVSSFRDSLTFTKTFDEYGMEKGRLLNNNQSNLHPFEILYDGGVVSLQRKKTLDSVTTDFDPITGNLLSRKRYGIKDAEVFGYDDLDRLVSVTEGNTETMHVEYAANGNIMSKTGIGDYNYVSGYKPHAVMSVDNAENLPSKNVITTFNQFDRIQLIEGGSGRGQLRFEYGPDLDRWMMVREEKGEETRKVFYIGAYERIIEGEKSREFYFLPGNVLIERKGGVVTPYFMFTDHLGSVLSIYDEDSNKVFDASYDAWGVQDVKKNDINFHRGYCGHEMLDEFGLINMNGRLYDPALARFLSPDPYVQFPDFTQSYNRYSYCLNNPLKYTDPSGQVSQIVAALIGAGVNMLVSVVNAALKGENIWKAAGLSLLSSLASYGIGSAFKAITMGKVGKELLRAGAHGLTSGLVSVLGGGNFWSGALGGSISSGVGSVMGIKKLDKGLAVFGSTLVGGLVSVVTGGDFISGALQGFRIGFLNHYIHKWKQSSYLEIDDEGNKELIIVNTKVVYYYTEAQIGPTPQTDNLGMASGLNTVIDSFGKANRDHSGGATIDDLGRYHWNGFKGNQWVSVKKAAAMGKNIIKVTGPTGKLIMVGQVLDALHEDNLYSEIYGTTDWYNTARTSAGIIGSTTGFVGGAKFGAWVGGMVGAWFGGVGAIPGAFIGSFIFEIGGAFLFDNLSTQTVDGLYGR